MKKTEIVTIEEKDYQLLSQQEIPDNPCDTCRSIGCCSCPKEREYQQAIRSYKEAGLM